MTMHYLATATVSVSGGSILFQNIPQNFDHLHIRLWVRSSAVASTPLTSNNAWDNLNIRLNGDGGANYTWHFTNVYYNAGDSRGTTTYGGGNILAVIPLSNSDSDMWSAHMIDIANYSNTTKLKTVMNMSGYVASTTHNWFWNDGGVFIGSSLWNSTAAVNSVQLFSAGFAIGTRADLYAISAPTGSGA